MNTITERVNTLLTEIRSAVDAGSFPDRENITITSDGRDVEKAFSISAGAVVVYPAPAIDWLAPRTSQLSWSIAVLSSDPDRTQSLVKALYDARVVRFGDKASPTDFKITDSHSIPGYTISHIEEHRS